MEAGRIVAVDGPVVDVQFDREEDVPNLYEAIKTRTFDERDLVLEVLEHLADARRALSAAKP